MFSWRSKWSSHRKREASVVKSRGSWKKESKAQPLVHHQGPPHPPQLATHILWRIHSVKRTWRQWLRLPAPTLKTPPQTGASKHQVSLRPIQDLPSLGVGERGMSAALLVQEN